MKSFLTTLTRNPISLLGAVLVTFAIAIIVTLFLLEFAGFEGGPYLGIMAYLVFPAILAIGLVMIPIGVRRERRRAAGGHRAFPVLDLNQGRTRNVILTVFALSVVNVMVFATATYKGVAVMESNEFCGTTCHSVMQPEYTAYVRSPHARVDCVDCHIGSGADWFAKSKLSGAWQVVSTTLDLYPRPIPTPVHDLRPARETCQQCHWPSSFVGNRLDVRTRYDDDEANTELSTVLLLRVGGHQGNGFEGIHWHVDPDVQIRYRSDVSRETIYDVEMRLADGTVKTFRGPAEEPEAAAGDEAELEWRTMDCVDCHNRPTHIYGLPGSEVDAALATGRIAADLPLIKKRGVAALEQEYASHEEARQGIRQAIRSFYEAEYAEIWATRREAVLAAAEELGDIYSNNVFPSMNVDWGTYPDHIGHEASPGCYRCHDDEHEAADGELISQDCDVCHGILAWDEEAPEILDTLEF